MLEREGNAQWSVLLVAEIPLAMNTLSLSQIPLSQTL